LPTKGDHTLERYLNDPSLNDYERIEAVKRRAEMMEEKARMEEKMIRLNGGDGATSANVEKTIAVNDIYIEAISAKLKILD